MRRYAIEIVRRVAAVVCLASTYEFAVSSFETKWLLVSLVSAFVVAMGPAYWTPPQLSPPPLPWPQRPMWRRLIPGWTLMTLSAGFSIAKLPPVIGLSVWVIGLVWLLWALRQFAKQDSPAAPRAPRSVRAWGLVLLVVAAVPRLWEIDSVPRYVHCDEAVTPTLGLQFYRDTPADLFGAVNAGDMTTMNLCYALGGVGALLGGYNLTATRAPDVILGTLSVLLLFDGLWRVSNVPVAVASALLLVANHPHLAFSRTGAGYIQTAFLVSLIFALFARVWTAPSYMNSALLGIATALGLQTYRASMVALPLLLGIMFLLALLHSERRRAWLAPFVIFALSGTAVGAPAAVTVWQQRQLLLSRSNALSIFTETKMNQLKRDVYHTDSAAEVVARQAWNSLRGFHVGYDTQPQYGSLYPMADPYTAALMVPGALFVLLRLREFVTLNSVIFTVGYLLLGLGLEWAPGFNRATGALTLGMVPPAIALVQCCGALWRGGGWLVRGARDLCLAAGVALCVYANFHIYFVDYKWSRLKGDASSEAGWVARQYYQQYTVHLVDWPLPGPEGQTLIISGLPIPRHKQFDSVAYVNNSPMTGSDLFIFDAQDQKAPAALLERFPKARSELWSRDPTGPNLTLVFVGQPRSNAKNGSG